MDFALAFLLGLAVGVLFILALGATIDHIGPDR